MNIIELGYETAISIRDGLLQKLYHESQSYGCSMYDVSHDVLRGMMAQHLTLIRDLQNIDNAIKKHEQELNNKKQEPLFNLLYSLHGKGENTDTTETQTNQR